MKAEIEALASHPHLGRVIGSHDRPCVLEIWFLRVRVDKAEVTHLLYGRVLPADFISGTWNGRAEDDFGQVDADLQADIGRVNLFTTASKATAFLIAFYSGRSFAEASADADVCLAKPVASRYASVALTGEFRLRTPMHLPARDYYRFESARLSPSGHISGTSASLSWLGKSSLFRIGDSSFPKLAAFCVERLNQETGLEFQDVDAWRLGDFELLVLPAKDDSERDTVMVDGAKEALTVSIERELMQVPAASYQVRFDFLNDECLVHTVVEVLPPGNLPLTVTVTAPAEVTSQVDAYRLSIDVQSSSDLVWYPCVRWGAYLAREVNLQIGLDGNTRIKWDWLSSTVRSAHQKRLQAVEQLASQKLTSGSVIGSRKGDAWVPANRQIRAWTRTLVPKESAGRFFLTYADGEGDGRLALVEWLRALLREHADKQFAWFDPYMEDVGVNLLATQGLGSENFIVLTNFPPPPRKRDWVDDLAKFLRTAESVLRRKPIVHKAKPDRMGNLIAAAEKWKRTGIGGRFRIACLPPEILHDRMILVTNGRNEPVVGYHLSNSIQLANENYPLLVTPIPTDVLQQVVPYMEGLLTPKSGKDGAHAASPAQIIYDSDDVDRKEKPRRKSMFEYPETPAVLAWWLQEPALAKLSAPDLRAELDKRGFLEGESLRSTDFEQLPPQLFTAALPFQDFDPAWAAMGSIAASSMSGDSIDAAVMPTVPSDTVSRLENYLSDRAHAERVHRVEGAVPDLDAELKAPIAALLAGSSRYLSAFSQFAVDVAWGDYYAIKLLWQAAPDKLAAWVHKTADEKWKDETRRQFCLKCAIGVISHRIEWGCSRQQLDALFTSQLDFLRWMGFVAVESILIGGQNSLQSMSSLPGVKGAVKAQLLGWLVARSSHGLDNVTYAALVADYLAALPPQLTKDELQDALRIQQGHMDRLFGGDLDVFSLVIVPLVEGGRLSVDIAAEAWVNELLRCWNNKDYSLLFRAKAEWPFTEQAGYLLASSRGATQKMLLKTLTSEVANWKRVVQKPLGSEADWSATDRSFRLLMWTNNLLKSAYINLPRPHQQEGAFTAIINDLDAVLRRRAARDWVRSGSVFLYRVHEAFVPLV